MKGVDFSTWGKYEYYDAKISFEESEKKLVLFLPENLNSLVFKKVEINRDLWKISFFNFSWTKYSFLIGFLLVLVFCWGNFFSLVQDLWVGKTSLGVGLFLKFLCSACGVALAIIMFCFWIPLIRFKGFLIISSRKKYDEKGKLIRGYVIALETQEEVNRINEVVSLLNKVEEKKKVSSLSEEEKKRKKKKIKEEGGEEK